MMRDGTHTQTKTDLNKGTEYKKEEKKKGKKWVKKTNTHSVTLGVWSHWVLGGQHAGWDEDTDQDDITEETVVANPMAEHTKPVEKVWEALP